MSIKGCPALVAALVVVTLATAGTADATFPGRNGRIAFTTWSGALFSPGGEVAAHAADCDFSYGTYVASVRPDGTEGRTIAGGGRQPAFSPAGDLAYWYVGDSCDFYGGPPFRFVIRRRPGDSGGDRRVRAMQSRSSAPEGLSWDSTGRRLAAGIGGRIWSLDVKHPVRRRIALVAGSAPAWSTRGELAFVARIGKSRERRLAVFAGGRARVLSRLTATAPDWSPLGRWGSAPDWSPGGRWLAFSSSRGAYTSTRIYVIRRDGRGLHALTSPGVADDVAPVWSPDGGQIAFTRLDDTHALMVMRRDGSQLRRIVPDGVEGELAWQPAGGKPR